MNVDVSKKVSTFHLILFNTCLFNFLTYLCFKLELESREKEAAARRKEAQKMAEKERIADKIRKEWEEEHEALRYEELQRQRMVNMTESNFIITVSSGL